MKTNKTPLTWNKNRDPACRRGKKTKNQSNFFHYSFIYNVYILKYKKKTTIIVNSLIYYHISMINMLSFIIKYLNSTFHIHGSWPLALVLLILCRTVNKENWKIHFSLQHGSKRDRNGRPVPQSAAQAQIYWICNICWTLVLHWETA